MEILFFIGVAIVFGLTIGKVSNRIKSPAVVGYLLVGILLGKLKNKL